MEQRLDANEKHLTTGTSHNPETLTVCFSSHFAKGNIIVWELNSSGFEAKFTDRPLFSCLKIIA